MAANDAHHGGQANAGAGKAFRVMQPLERLEQLVGVGLVEAGAIAPEDLQLYQVVDTPEQAWAAIREFYRL